MVPAAGVLLWALLLSLGSWAAGAQDQTRTSTPTTLTLTSRTSGMPRATFRFGGGGPARSRRSTPGSARSRFPRKNKIALEDENDAVATADRLAGPAASELLATVTSIHPQPDYNWNKDEDETLEEGVLIDAGNRERTAQSSPGTTETSSTHKITANKQDREIRLTTSLTPTSSRSTGDAQSEVTLGQWSTAGSRPSQWPRHSRTAMPAPEDLQVVLMPWGPWHCHCKSGTMSRSRAGRLQGLSGRLRVGALSQLRREHRPCTYEKCPCNRLQEECPLDSGLCSDCSTKTITTTTTEETTTPMPPLHLRRRPSPPPPSASPAMEFWKRVRMGLEDIWNSLSSVFTEMQPNYLREERPQISSTLKLNFTFSSLGLLPT